MGCKKVECDGASGGAIMRMRSWRKWGAACLIVMMPVLLAFLSACTTPVTRESRGLHIDVDTNGLSINGISIPMPWGTKLIYSVNVQPDLIGP